MNNFKDEIKYMKKVRVLINMVLGACSLLLAGCHLQKKVEHQPALLYGVPVEYYQQLEQQAKDSTENKQDTMPIDTKEQMPSMPAPGIMVKYGVPRPPQQ